jgi:uncharacterized repeat protein (TIGR03803 family)
MKHHRTTPPNRSGKAAFTKPVPGRKPLLAPLTRLLWTALLALPAFGTQASVVFTNLHSFQVSPIGAYPYAEVVQGSDGYFYGTTLNGGTNGNGTVFKISTNGALTSLYSFTGGNDGAYPDAGLLQGSDGNFYGMTFGGGTNGNGTVFKITANGALTHLYSFSGGIDGANPYSGLVQGRDGNFYGTTTRGGTKNAGTVFKISTNGVLTHLYSFTGVNDGASPYAGLVQGNDGNFYGTTQSGGQNYDGTVFKISTSGALTNLYSFTGGNDGQTPYSGLVQGNDGYFYGTTAYGGTGNNAGTVFQISTNGALTSLYSFTGGNDGAHPDAGLLQGSDGNFYGMTFGGGTGNNAGTVFQISTNGAYTTLYSFTGGNDGRAPYARLALGSDGNFYGTTSSGGTNSFGSVFKISANGVLTGLYSFPGTDDGAGPNELVLGSDGSFYGTTSYGAANNSGTVFDISSSGILTTLYSFTGRSDDGANPESALVQGSDGYFYGTTLSGGAYTNQNGQGNGTVFKVSSLGFLTLFYSFTGGSDGTGPQSGLVQGRDGNFYGTTYNGGPSSAGTVFNISTDGTLTSLYAFAGGKDGQFPSGLVQGGDGNFYGTTAGGGTHTNQYGEGYGTVFKINTNGALTSLYAFTGGKDGQIPSAGLMQGADGNFYGTTSGGGNTNLNNGFGYGTVFKITPAGALTNLYSFTGGKDGQSPSGLVQGRDGSFCGTTTSGGNTNLNNGFGYGTVFQLTPAGALTSLHLFTGGNDGGDPGTRLVQGRDGSFYGTTYNGGQGNVGIVFRLTIVPEAPQLTIAVSGVSEAVKLSFSSLTVGLSYQLESSTNLNTWTNLGVPFQATNTNMAYPTNFDVNDSGQLFFRLQKTLDCVVSGTQPDHDSFVAGLQVLAAAYGLEYTLQSTGRSGSYAAVSRVMTLDPNGCVIAYCNANPQYCWLTTTTATCVPFGDLVLPAGLSVVTWGPLGPCNNAWPFSW